MVRVTVIGVLVRWVIVVLGWWSRVHALVGDASVGKGSLIITAFTAWGQ